MAMSGPRPCLHPGCGLLVKDVSGRCEPHRKQKLKQADIKRGSPSERGYGHKWQQAREHYLRQHPMCECDACKALIVGRLASQVIDHIIPHRLFEAKQSGDVGRVNKAQDLFWNRHNWCAMNKICHDKKTARQDGGFGRAGACKSLPVEASRP